jgi:hypothetical protein
MLTDTAQSEVSVRANDYRGWTGHRQHVFRREYGIAVVFLEVVWGPR